jgi:plastocyanin
MDLSFDAVHPGVWMFHCHIEHHMANGMMTVIQYEGHQPTGPGAETMDETITHGDHGAHGEHGDAAATPAATAAPEETASAASGDEVVVELIDDRFNPYSIDVPAGTTVTWVNKGRNLHNVVSSSAGFASNRLAPGESFSFAFENPGTYQIVCRHHGLAGMSAVVNVT